MRFDIQNGVLKKVYYCEDHVVIPDSVTSIRNGAFYGCSSLQSVVISPDHPYFSFKNDMLIGRNGILNFALGTIVHAVIPDSVTHIINRAFSGCSSLQSVVIPDSVTSIGEFAFRNCSSLQSVVIPDSVTYISDYAFSGCSSLRSVTLAKHHFRTNSIFDALNTASIITCIALISDVPNRYRSKACIGFALHENEYPEDFRKGYLDYIRTHAAKMCEAALQSPELLHLMCREKLIGADVFPDFLDESLRREAVEATAFLLEYKQNCLTDAAFPQDDDLSLD